MLVKNIWIINDAGVCLVHYGLETSNKAKKSELTISTPLFSAFTSALVGNILALGISESNFYSLNFQKRRLYYYYKNKIIICLEADKKGNERIIKTVIKKLHHDFLLAFENKINSNKLEKLSMYISFKEKIAKTLRKTNLLQNQYNFKMNVMNFLVKVQNTN